MSIKVDLDVAILTFICLVLFVLNFKVYKFEEFTVGMQLFVVLNTFATMFTLFKTLNFHTEQVDNEKALFYNKLVKGVFSQTITLFMAHPEMGYFYDELFNAKCGQRVHARNKGMEQMIGLQILQSLTDYIEYYTQHAAIPSYQKSLKLQNQKMLKIVDNFMKCPAFRKQLESYLEKFAGDNAKKYFKKFYHLI